MADHLVRADAAQPGIVGTEADHLVRADAAQPGIVGTQAECPWV